VTDRRAFILATAGGLLAAPLAAGAQPGSAGAVLEAKVVPRIAVLRALVCSEVDEVS